MKLADLEQKRNTHVPIDFDVVEFAALLHDIEDSKYGGSDDQQASVITQFLSSLGVDQDMIEKIVQITLRMSFRKELGQSTSAPTTIELDIVRDADRLDAIGAIGIARCMIFTGAKNSLLYDPALPPLINITKEQYEAQSKDYKKNTAVNHFYGKVYMQFLTIMHERQLICEMTEKLFKLKDLIRTESGKAIAEQRHQVMVDYIDAFKSEWHDC